MRAKFISRKLQQISMYIRQVQGSAVTRLRNLRTPPKPGSKKRTDPYYPAAKSCQIPNLSFIYERFLGATDSGTFVEVGAFDGVFVSNSWGLAERNWDGLMIEPQRDAFLACVRNHRVHPRVRVERTAVGAPGVKSLDLRKAGALTTANPNLEAEYENVAWSSPHLTANTESVPCETLDDLLARCQIPTNFEVLIVDVEGFEEQVFCGFSIEYWRPKVLVVELADMHPDLWTTARTDARLLSAIQKSGYQIVYKDHINTVLVHSSLWSGRYGLS